MRIIMFWVYNTQCYLFQTNERAMADKACPFCISCRQSSTLQSLNSQSATEHRSITINIEWTTCSLNITPKSTTPPENFNTEPSSFLANSVDLLT